MDVDELVTELRSSGAETLAAMIAVPAAALENAGYENGWTVRQIMAHVASMEFAYRGLPDLARRAGDAARSGGGDAGFAMDRYNARQIEKRRDTAPAALIDEFMQGRGALIALVSRLDPPLLATPIRSAGGSSGSLAEVIEATAAGHVRGHAFDFIRAAGGHETSERDIAAAAVLLIAHEAEALLDGVSPTVWRTPLAGEWSPADLCGHIAEMLPYWAEHARRAITASALVGRPLDAPERLGGPARFATISVEDGIGVLSHAARQAAETIRLLPLDSWQQLLPHRNGGAVPLAKIIESGGCVGHGREHLDQLRQLLLAAR